MSSRTKVSVPLVAGQGDIFEFDGDDRWVIEETTHQAHYATIRNPDTGRVLSFETAAYFRDWMSFREEFSLIKAGSARAEELDISAQAEAREGIVVGEAGESIQAVTERVDQDQFEEESGAADEDEDGDDEDSDGDQG